MRSTGSFALLCAVLAASTLTRPARLDGNLSKRGEVTERGLSKLLIASSPTEAAAYDEHVADFAASVNYGEEVRTLSPHSI